MRDGRAGGAGYDAASNPGGPGWEQGSYGGGYRDDARSYTPDDRGPHAPDRTPGYGAPGYGAPGYADPQYGGPGHGAPQYGAPPYGEPDQADPGSGHDGAIPGPRSGGHGSGPDGPGDGDGPGGGGPGDPAAGGHRRGGRRKPRSGKRKALRWIAVVAAVAVLGTAGAAYGYYEYLASKIRKGERSSGSTNVAKPKVNPDGTAPMNIMILGSDTRSDPEDAKLGGAADATGARADVIMIAHLAADRSNMSVVSIPRDTRVDIPQCTDPKTHKVYPKTNDIINASLSRGGAGCTLATVQNLTGVYIDHWLIIDFAGVVKMADVVGGVDVCVKENV